MAFTLDVVGIASKRKENAQADRVQDPYQEFLMCLKEYDFDISAVQITGDKVERCKSNNSRKNDEPCWYTFDIINGVGFGAFGDWRIGETHFFRSENHKTLSPEERLKNDEAYRIAKEEKRRRIVVKQNEMATYAQKKLSSLSECSKEFYHPYLKNKNVKAYGLKTDSTDLYIPIRVGQNLTSYQKISAEGQKHFLVDSMVEGGYHYIQGTIKKTYVTEGYATGATIHKVTGANVLVCFNASNLPKVIKSMRDNGIDDPFIVAADNDHMTEAQGKRNAGIHYAKECCEKYKNVTMIYPTEIKGSDFNDLQNEKGIEAVKEVLTGKRNRISILQVDQLPAMPEKWFIKKFLPQKKVGIVFGASGHMKSFIVIDMALHLCAGMDWHGFKVKDKHDVLYVCGEGAAGIRNRVIAWKSHHKIKDPINFLMTSSPVLLLEREQTSSMLESLQDHMIDNGIEKYPSLIVIDTLNRNFGDGDENNTQDMTRFINSLEELHSITGSMFIVVHHSSKGNSEQARGNASLKNSSDCEYRVEMTNYDEVKEGFEEPNVHITCTKMKDYGAPEPLDFRTSVIKLGEDEDGDDITSVVMMRDKKMNMNLNSLMKRPVAAAETEADKCTLCLRDALITVAAQYAAQKNIRLISMVTLDAKQVDTVYKANCQANKISDTNRRKSKQRAKLDLEAAKVISLKCDTTSYVVIGQLLSLANERAGV